MAPDPQFALLRRAALAGAALILAILLLPGCDAPSAPAQAAAPASANRVSIPADLWQVSPAPTYTPGPAPTPPRELHWTATDGDVCDWYASTQQITCRSIR